MTVFALLRFILGKTLTVYLARLIRGHSRHGALTQAKRFLSTTTIFRRCQRCEEVVVHKYDKLHENCHDGLPLAEDLLQSGLFDPKLADA